MKIYRGWRDDDGVASVEVREPGHEPRPLRLRLDLDNHSPCGFEWGYGGSGPAQLALALLADALDDDRRAARLHQMFKWKFVAALPQDADMWEIEQAEIVRYVDVMESKMPGRAGT